MQACDPQLDLAASSMCFEHGRDMAMGQRPFDHDRVLARWQHGATFEQRAQALDQGGDQSLWLSKVRFLTLPSTRQLSRSRVAGGEFGGTASNVHGYLCGMRPLTKTVTMQNRSMP